VLAVEEDLTVLPLGRASIHRYPAERTADTVGFTPSQPLLPELFSPGDVLLGDHL